MADSTSAPGPGLLTGDEWAIVDAVRRAQHIAEAASALDLDDGDFRRRLSAVGEKLRMSSVLADTAISAGSGRFHVPHLDPCPYCENFAGRFSTRSGAPAVIHEDDSVYVFLAPAPLGGMPGHTLVTTKRHVETVFDLTDDEASTLGMTVARVARMLRSALDPEGMLIQQNNGAAAFQTVPHIHFHVIPKVAGPFPPHEAPHIIPSDERNAFASQLREHW
jgi:histidine triad (HIT) family protein